MKKKFFPRTIFLGLACLCLVALIIPALAIEIREESVTDTGTLTYAWAYVIGYWNGQWYTYTGFDHASGVPGSQGSALWWATDTINHDFYYGGHVVGALSITRTFPYGGDKDADAQAEI